MTNITHTVSTTLISNTVEALAFNDGHVEIEDPLRNFEEVPSLPNITLDRERARDLRDWLNSIEL